jgi:hypothetical protein
MSEPITNDTFASTAMPWLRNRHDHPAWFGRCPRCDTVLDRGVAMVDLAYVFDECSCEAATYVHLVEQLWHRTCHAAEAGEQATEALTKQAEITAAARAEAFATAIRMIVTEARRGGSLAPAAQNLTYEGGLRRAAAVLKQHMAGKLRHTCGGDPAATEDCQACGVELDKRFERLADR